MLTSASLVFLFVAGLAAISVASLCTRLKLVACPCAEAQRIPCFEVTERKVELVLEQGVRADRRAADAFVASSTLQRLTLADYQHRIEALRMFGYSVASVPVRVFHRGLVSYLLPRFAFVREHACAPCCAALSMCHSQPSFTFACASGWARTASRPSQHVCTVCMRIEPPSGVPR